MGACDEESAECKQAVRQYNDADFDRSTATQDIGQANSDIDRAEKQVAAGAAAVGGGVSLGLASAGFGAVFGGILAAAGGTIAAVGGVNYLRARRRRDAGREACQEARLRMRRAYLDSETRCREAQCRPPATIPACP